MFSMTRWRGYEFLLRRNNPILNEISCIVAILYILTNVPCSSCLAESIHQANRHQANHHQANRHQADHQVGIREVGNPPVATVTENHRRNRGNKL